MKVFAATVIVTANLALTSAWAGDPQAGQRIADRWCSSCHGIDELHAGRGVAPSFPWLAGHARSREWVRGWLMKSHPSMPDMSLSRGEIDNLIAYLDSLVPPKGD